MSSISGFRSRIVLIVFVLLCGLFLASPVLLRLGIEQWLVRNGADEVQVGSLRLHPLAGVMTLHEVRIVQNDTQVLNGKTVKVRLDPAALLHKILRLQRVELDTIHLDIRAQRNGDWQVGSLPIIVAQETGRAGKAADQETGNWIVRIDTVQVRNGLVRLFVQEGELDLEIEQGTLERFSTDPADPAGRLVARGIVGGARVDLDLGTFRVVPRMELAGTVAVQDLSLSRLVLFTDGYDLPLEGKLSTQGTMELVVGEDGSLHALQDGEWTLHDATSLVSGLKGGADFLVWKGQGELVGQDRLHLDLQGTLTGGRVDLQIPSASLALREQGVSISGSASLVLGDGLEVKSKSTIVLERIELDQGTDRLEVAGFRWKGKLSHGGAAGRLTALDGTASLSRLVLASGDSTAPATLEVADIGWEGVVEHVPTTGPQKRFSLQGSLSCDALQGAFARQRIRQEQITLRGQGALVVGGEMQDARFDGSLHLGTDRFSSNGISWNSRGGSWAGSIRYRNEGKGPARLTVSGQAELEAFALLTDGDRIRLQGETIKTSGDLTLKDFSMPSGEIGVQSTGLRLEKTGEASILEMGSLGVDRLHLAGNSARIGQLRARDFRIAAPGKSPYAAEVEYLHLADLQFAGYQPTALAELTMDSVRVQARGLEDPLVVIGSLQTTDITFKDLSAIACRRVSLADIGFLRREREDRHGCQVGEAKVTDLEWNAEKGVHGANILLQNADCRLRREKNGTLDLIQILGPLRPGNGPALGRENGKKAASPGLRLDQITLQGHNTLHYEDHTLTVPFHSLLVVSLLQLSGLDTSQPDQPMDFVLKGSLEKRAPLKVHGQVRPFGNQLVLNMAIDLKNYPLSNLSSYTVETVGRNLGHGRLQLDSNLKIQEGQLEMDNRLVFSQLETETVSRELAAKLDSKLPLPLDSAIRFLQDKDSKIVLDIPVSGPLADLHVGISDLLVTALARSLVPAASSYLMYTLGPYGALAYIGAKVGEGLLRTRLAPLVYPAGVLQLDEKQKEYCARLARLLRERPKIDLYLCPVVSTAELDTAAADHEKAVKDIDDLSEDEKQELLERGQERARRLSVYLRDFHGIDKTRILVCKTRLEAGSEPSRLDLQL